MEPNGEVIAFGPYRLDRTSGRLLHGERNVPLRLKTFAVLEYLATRPGRLVRKDELLDAVWPDTCVTPSVLTGCIRELRRALGDDARAARFVETAHRRGYRFIAAPMPAPACDASAAPTRAPSSGASAAPVVPPGRYGDLIALARRFTEAIAGVIEAAPDHLSGATPSRVDPRHTPRPRRRDRDRKRASGLHRPRRTRPSTC